MQEVTIGGKLSEEYLVSLYTITFNCTWTYSDLKMLLLNESGKHYKPILYALVSILTRLR